MQPQVPRSITKSFTHSPMEGLCRLTIPSSNRNDPTTEQFTAEDYKFWNESMMQIMKEFPIPIRVLVLHSPTTSGVQTSRGFATAIGMKGHATKTRIGKEDRARLQSEVVGLLMHGKTIKTIHRIFTERGMSVTERSLQRWAKKNKLNRRPGNPNYGSAD